MTLDTLPLLIKFRKENKFDFFFILHAIDYLEILDKATRKQGIQRNVKTALLY